MGTRLKWAMASYVVSLEAEKSFSKVDIIRGMWSAFWMAHDLEKESSIHEFFERFVMR